ncbi:hypothetical protein [Streptomyces sp. NPDC056948]|uniref:hypothetical protein n=1 Tax=Streptomyces sp. NPDC056948 TaxID=3345975 RepID=UPI00362C2F10
MHAATLPDWAAAISFGIAGYAVLSVPYFLLVDADPSDFDPRPAVRRAIESGRLDPALIAVVNTRHAAHEAADRVRNAPRHAAISTAALLMLLTAPAPEATR